MNPKILVKALKLLMLKRKIRQYELASILKCPPTTLNRWLMGKHKISQAWINVIHSNSEIGNELAEIERTL